MQELVNQDVKSLIKKDNLMRFSNLELYSMLFFIVMGLAMTGLCFYKSIESTFTVFIFVLIFIYSCVGMIKDAHKINWFDGLGSGKPPTERDFKITRISAQGSAILSFIFPCLIYFE